MFFPPSFDCTLIFFAHVFLRLYVQQTHLQCRFVFCFCFAKQPLRSKAEFPRRSNCKKAKIITGRLWIASLELKMLFLFPRKPNLIMYTRTRNNNKQQQKRTKRQGKQQQKTTKQQQQQQSTTNNTPRTIIIVFLKIKQTTKSRMTMILYVI